MKNKLFNLFLKLFASEIELNTNLPEEISRKELLKELDPTFEELMEFCIKGRKISFRNKEGFANLEKDFLSDLSEAERKNKIAELAVISRNEVFQQFIADQIDFFGTNCVIKSDEEEMKNAQTALIAVQAMQKRLKGFEIEFSSYGKEEQDEE